MLVLERTEPTTKGKRARPLPTADHDEVVREVMADMCSGRWQAGVSHRELAARFGVAAATVEGWASEACRFLRMCRGREDEIRELILSGIENLGRLALDHQKLVYSDGAWQSHPEPDLKGYAASLELRARVYGIIGPDARKAGPLVSVPGQELVGLLKSDGVRSALKSQGYTLALLSASEEQP
jgi:hypothetical protein